MIQFENLKNRSQSMEERIHFDLSSPTICMRLVNLQELISLCLPITTLNSMWSSLNPKREDEK
jgi:hypothetical protein